ncbi:hypothetical protein ABPG72_021645 [Tetrahymena utriculariae]
MSSKIPPHVQLQEPLEINTPTKEDENVVEIIQNQQEDIENNLGAPSKQENDCIRIMRNYGQAYPRNFGKYCVFRFKDNEPTIAIGPHWPLFLFTYIILSLASYKLIEYTIELFSAIYCFFSILISVTLLVSFMLTALKNPGISSAKYQILNEQDVVSIKRYCKPCQILRPKGTSHCYDCDVCIKEYDHHCPWTGKCIGYGNLQVFYIFVMSVMTFMIYSILLVFSKI